MSATKTITKLKRQLKRAGISQERVALEANVTRTMVNHVVNGRARSRRVLFAIERLLERCAEAAHA